MHHDQNKQWLVFSDLDGSLLDHNTYSHSAADACLQQLRQAAIPVICCTSKTRAELLQLRQALHNHDPFIVENGAAVYIPEQYFAAQPEGTISRDGFWVKEFCRSRNHWLELLRQVPPRLLRQLASFASLDTAGIAAATGLAAPQAQLANQREYSEPLIWHGSAAARQSFIHWVNEHHGRVQQGGRFLHLTDQGDKGKAMLWLRDQYQHFGPDQTFVTLALGDGHNDVPMLEAASHAVIIRSPAHTPPTLQRPDFFLSEATGPSGWTEGVYHFLGQSRLFTSQTQP